MAEEISPAENPELLQHRNEPNPAASLRMKEGFVTWMQESGKALIVDGLKGALDKADLDLDDIDTIIPHQAFGDIMDMWKEALKEQGVPESKWRDTWNKYGNIGAVDVAATLSEAIEAGELADNALIAWFAPGAGGHTPTMLVRWRA